MSESRKGAVLAKCEDVANVILDNDWSVAKSPTIAGKFYMEQGDSENFLTLSEDLPSDAWQWGVAAEILKITPSIDEFEDDLSRRQYHHDLEVARKEGYEQGKAEALEKTLKDAENELFQLVMAEIGSYFHTSIIHTIRKLKESPRPSDALLREAIKQGFIWSGHIKDEREDAWEDWLATIPPDPLKADRELVKNIFRVSKFVTVSPEMKLWASIARLAGLEAPNE